MQFDEAADFKSLKGMVLDAAFENDLDIFDNVFDWSIRLTQPKISSQARVGKPSEQISENSKLRPYSSAVKKKVSIRLDDGVYDLAKKHRFNTFEDVKKLIYQIYGR